MEPMEAFKLTIFILMTIVAVVTFFTVFGVVVSYIISNEKKRKKGAKRHGIK